jgi:hypothetical protein
VFAQLRDDEELDTPLLPPADADDEETVVAFRRLVLTLPPIQRRALSLHAAAGLPVPQFMQDMALLVRDGLFCRVYTSAFDALAERALTIVGLRSGQNLHVVDVADEDGPPRERSGVVLIKVHGMRVPGPLPDPIVVVGHQPDDAEIFGALTVREAESVWWVGLDPPPPELDALAAVRPVRVITIHPDRFFGELAVLAVQMPAVNALAKSSKGTLGRLPPAPATKRAPSISATLAVCGGTAPPPGGDEFERQFLEGRLRRSEEILGRLQLQAAAGSSAVDSTLERQLAYQRHEIALAEEKLRGIGSQRNTLLDVLTEIADAPEAQHDGGAVAYLHDTIERIRTEYEGDDPDEDVVSAALATIGVLGTRLGVGAPLLQKLDTFVPSAQGIAL